MPVEGLGDQLYVTELLVKIHHFRVVEMKDLQGRRALKEYSQRIWQCGLGRGSRDDL